jgi:hypothetical protein
MVLCVVSYQMAVIDQVPYYPAGLSCYLCANDEKRGAYAFTAQVRTDFDSMLARAIIKRQAKRPFRDPAAFDTGFAKHCRPPSTPA